MSPDPTGAELGPHPGLTPGWFVARSWTHGDRHLRPLARADLGALMRWRNEQQAVLRQQEPLTIEHQERWFRDVVEPSYCQTHPRALQVVALDDGPVAYGGLTNIEWVSRRAELSFLAATERVEPHERYAGELRRFLEWTASFCFDELGFNRLFTETWDFREDHIAVLEEFGFVREGRMRQHVAKEGRVHDAVLHGLLAEDWRTA
ncbi:MAG: GNAT family protein [Actinomycetota bacterium]